MKFTLSLLLGAIPVLTQSCGVTDQTGAGPYYRNDSPFNDNMVPAGFAGKTVTVSGQVKDRDCNPITCALVDVWSADANGQYSSIYGALDASITPRGHVVTDNNGYYSYKMVLPAPYSDDKFGMRPAHIHNKVFLDDKRYSAATLTTQIYFQGDPYLYPKDSCPTWICGSDKTSLIRPLVPTKTSDSYTLKMDLVLDLAGGVLPEICYPSKTGVQQVSPVVAPPDAAGSVKDPRQSAPLPAVDLDDANALCKTNFPAATCTGIYDTLRTAVAYALGFSSLQELITAKIGGLDISAKAASLGVDTTVVKADAILDYLVRSVNYGLLTESDSSRLLAIFGYPAPPAPALETAKLPTEKLPEKLPQVPTYVPPPGQTVSFQVFSDPQCTQMLRQGASVTTPSATIAVGECSFHSYTSPMDGSSRTNAFGRFHCTENSVTWTHWPQSTQCGSGGKVLVDTLYSDRCVPIQTHMGTTYQRLLDYTPCSATYDYSSVSQESPASVFNSHSHTSSSKKSGSKFGRAKFGGHTHTSSGSPSSKFVGASAGFSSFRKGSKSSSTNVNGGFGPSQEQSQFRVQSTTFQSKSGFRLSNKFGAQLRQPQAPQPAPIMSTFPSTNSVQQQQPVSQQVFRQAPAQQFQPSNFKFGTQQRQPQPPQSAPIMNTFPSWNSNSFQQQPMQQMGFRQAPVQQGQFQQSNQVPVKNFRSSSFQSAFRG